MTWLLDTNVVSEGIKTRPNERVTRWITEQPRDSLFIGLITLAELHNGSLLASDSNLRTRISKWIDDHVISFFDNRIVSISVDILVDWIQLSQRLRAVGLPRDSVDLLIAATARMHNLTLVTRNVRDFADTGVVVYDPWNDRTHRMSAP